VIDTREALISALENYTSAYPTEVTFVSNFLYLLQSDKAFERTHLPGHITGSVWVVDEAKEYVLLTHHAKLNRWLQLGGHADGDENVLRVALREAEEETGLKNFRLLSNTIFDIDIHPIPERKDFPAHDHYDIRFLLQADRREKIIISEESHDVAWIPLAQLDLWNNADSLKRMAQKVNAQNIGTYNLTYG
jgi:8-oxo-dGTP pyrophosphatase MutT (NUDIX family)